jgi:hypothetical protein
MSVEIVGPLEEYKKTTTCWACRLILEYLPIDVIRTEHKDFHQHTHTFHWITCPSCNTDVCVGKD